MKIDICVPAFNEYDNINTLFNNFVKIKDENKYVGNLIFIDNGSTDSTQKLLATLKHPNFKCYRVENNLKYGGGMALGIEKSESDFVCLLPADNQFSFDYVSKGIEQFFTENNFQSILIKGSRINRMDPIQIRILSQIYTFAVNLSLRIKIKDINGLPKIFGKQKILNLLEYLPKDASFDASLIHLLISKNFEIIEFDIPYQNRKYGKSSWESKKFLIGTKMLISFMSFRNTLKNLDKK